MTLNEQLWKECYKLNFMDFIIPLPSIWKRRKKIKLYLLAFIQKCGKANTYDFEWSRLYVKLNKYLGLQILKPIYKT